MLVSLLVAPKAHVASGACNLTALLYLIGATFVEVARTGGGFMPKAYWVAACRSVKNPAALAEYAKRSGAAIQAAGDRILVRGTPAKTYETGVDQRTVVIEFESVAAAIAAHDSPAYQAAMKVLGDAAERDIRIVEGVG
jgi:uncharacterized protein (DUF1330 family)